MKNKWILSLLAVLLMTAMLLPLASCMPRGQGGVGTIKGVPTEAPVPTEEEIVGMPSEPENSNIIPHTPEMLALQEKWESSDEEWTKKLNEFMFLPITKDMECRKDEKYRIRINILDLATHEKIVEKVDEIEIPEEDRIGVVRKFTDSYYYLYVTPEQIEELAKVDGNFVINRYNKNDKNKTAIVC